MASVDGREGEVALFDLARADAVAGKHTNTSRALTLLAEGVGADLPPVARAALDHARRVWWDQADSPVTLTESRVKCWRYLDDKNQSSTLIADREDHAVRLLICCLRPPAEDMDVYLSVEFALDMLLGLGVDDATIDAAVREVTLAERHETDGSAS